MEQLDILAFAAHPDDVELAASGTLVAHINKGYRVGIIDLTQGELGSRGTIDTRYAEASDAAKIMGISVRENLKLADGFFQGTEESLLKIVEQIRRFRPKIVLCNAVTDRHPDHGKGSKVVSDACFLSGLRKVETSWNGIGQDAYRPEVVYHYIQDRYIKPDFVVDVTEYVDVKLEAIKAFKTQFWDPNSSEPKTPISGEEFFDFLKGRMAEFGRAIGVRYAEGFTVERFIGVNNLFDLK